MDRDTFASQAQQRIQEREATAAAIMDRDAAVMEQAQGLIDYMDWQDNVRDRVAQAVETANTHAGDGPANISHRTSLFSTEQTLRNGAEVRLRSSPSVRERFVSSSYQMRTSQLDELGVIDADSATGHTHGFVEFFEEEGQRAARKVPRHAKRTRDSHRGEDGAYTSGVPFEGTGHLSRVGLRLYAGSEDGDDLVEAESFDAPLLSPTERQAIEAIRDAPDEASFRVAYRDAMTLIQPDVYDASREVTEEEEKLTRIGPMTIRKYGPPTGMVRNPKWQIAMEQLVAIESVLDIMDGVAPNGTAAAGSVNTTPNVEAEEPTRPTLQLVPPLLPEGSNDNTDEPLEAILTDDEPNEKAEKLTYQAEVSPLLISVYGLRAAVAEIRAQRAGKKASKLDRHSLVFNDIADVTEQHMNGDESAGLTRRLSGKKERRVAKQMKEQLELIRTAKDSPSPELDERLRGRIEWLRSPQRHELAVMNRAKQARLVGQAQVQRRRQAELRTERRPVDVTGWM